MKKTTTTYDLPNIKGEYKFNEILAPLTRFKVGGPAQILFIPKDIEDLKSFFKNYKESLPITILGLGSNVLISDKGIKGIVLLLKNLNKIEFIKNDEIIAQAFAVNPIISKQCMKKEISGLEYLSCIPGTIAGGLLTNAGAYGSQLSDNVISVFGINRKGKEIEISNKDCEFKYRHSNFPKDFIITSVLLKGKKDKAENILNKINEMLEKKNSTQPTGEKNAGSCFKNPPQAPAWKLIQEAGLQNFRINDAGMSKKHCNFMTNHANASATDIKNCIDHIKKKVKEKFNINLQEEIKYLGEF